MKTCDVNNIVKIMIVIVIIGLALYSLIESARYFTVKGIKGGNSFDAVENLRKEIELDKELLRLVESRPELYQRISIIKYIVIPVLIIIYFYVSLLDSKMGIKIPEMVEKSLKKWF